MELAQGKWQLLHVEMMGHNATVPGVIVAEDGSGDLKPVDFRERVRTSLPACRRQEWGRAPVSTENRARPLMGLLSTAAKANTQVMWK